MNSEPRQEKTQSIKELLIVMVGDHEYCIDISKTLGINRVSSITSVPKSQRYVRGIINLRGQVVTVLDLGLRLGQEATCNSLQNRIIIIQDHQEDIGLLVDKVVDVIPVESEHLEPPPANLGGVGGRFFESVYRDDSRVIGILDMNEIISVDVHQKLAETEN